MKAIVTTKFRDKNTKKIYKVGDKIELTDERFAEINKAGYVEAAVAEEKPKKKSNKE